MRDKQRVNREQWECVQFLKRAGSIPAARKLAKAEGKSYQTSDWLAAVGLVIKKYP